GQHHHQAHADQQGAHHDQAVEVQRRGAQPVPEPVADPAPDVAEGLVLVGAHDAGGATGGAAGLPSGVLRSHARSPGSRVTAAANRPPRSAESRNWSMDAAAGASSTTSPFSASA